MRKLISMVGLLALVTASIQIAGATSYIIRQVGLNQPFSMTMNETVRFGDYPVTLRFDSYSYPPCSYQGPCPSPSANFTISYPGGSKSFTFYGYEQKSFLGATLYMVDSSGPSVTLIASAATLPHAPGTNFRFDDGSVWFITPNYERRAYTSAAAFLSYGFNNWESVQPANAADLILPQGDFVPPADGRIICSDRDYDRGTCYLIMAGKKAGFSSEAAFRGLGFNFSRAFYGDVSWMPLAPVINSPAEMHRPGTLILKNRTIYIVVGDTLGSPGLVGIPSMEVFNSWGFSFADVVPANEADNSLLEKFQLSKRQPGQLNGLYLGQIYYPL